MNRFLRSLLACLVLALAPTQGRGTVVAALGDSNTWIGGDGCDQARGWTYWLARLMPAQVRSYARSGATWSHAPGSRPDPAEYAEVITPSNVVTSQVMRLVADSASAAPDIIVCAAGVNDAWFRDRRPGALEGEVAGAVAEDCRRLRAAFPGALLVLVTPPRCGKVSDADTGILAGEIARSAPEGAAVVRGDLDPGFKEEGMTSDGVHLTPKGARRLAELIMDNLSAGGAHAN